MKHRNWSRRAFSVAVILITVLLVLPTAARANCLTKAMVAAGESHSLGLKSDGSVLAIGYDGYGQTAVADWAGIKQVAGGWYHTVGLKADGSVVAVGSNTYGQLNTVDWTGITQIAAGWYHTAGLKSDGTVLVVGNNNNGQGNVSEWAGITQVAAGGYHTVGLKADGTVVAAGYNGNGQGNVGSWTGITQIAAGGSHTVGLKADGTVVVAGDNTYGQGLVSSWTDIVQVAAGRYHTVGLKANGTVVATGNNNWGQTGVGGWTGIAKVAAGGSHTLGMKTDGTVVSAGNNNFGQSNVADWALVIAGEPPAINAGPDAAIVEGSVFTAAGAYAGQDGFDYTAVVDYGDSSGTQPLALNTDQTFTLSHAYANEGSYVVTITITDCSGAVGTDTINVTVTNAMPLVNTGPDAAIFSGQSLNLSVGFSDAGISDNPWAYVIDWGDGASSNGASGVQGAGVIAASHPYLVPGKYAVAIRITDKDGGIGADGLALEVKALPVTLDTKQSMLNTKKKGNIQIGVLTGVYEGVDFDATAIATGSLKFRGAPATVISSTIRDLDKDGWPDMLFVLDNIADPLPVAGTEALLSGSTAGGLYFAGWENVTPAKK